MKFPGIVIGFLTLVLSTGCDGSKKGSISGRVTLDGQPIESGSLTFIPMESTQGSAAGAAIGKGGHYEIARDLGPVAGTYRVEIRAQRKTGKQVPVGSPAPAGTMTDEVEEAIPAQYNVKSTLIMVVKSGKNNRDFELTTK